MKKVKYYLFLLLAFMFISTNLNAEINFNILEENGHVTIDTADPYQINYSGDISSITLVSSNEEVATVSDTGLITPVADGFTLIYVKDSTENHYNHQVGVIVTKDGTIEADLNDAINSYDSLELDFSKDLMTLDIEVVHDNGSRFLVEDYGSDYIYTFAQPYSEYIRYNTEFTDTTCDIEAEYSVHYIFNGNGLSVTGPKSIKKTIPIVFPTENEEDKEYVKNFAKSLSRKYYSYINSNPYEQVDMDKLIENANFDSAFDKFDILHKLDIRYGDSSPESAMLGGYILLGKNGVYYTAKHIELWRTLKVPTNNGMSLLEMIIKYFEDYVLKAGESVRVEHVSDNIYRAHVSSNQLSFLDRLGEIIMPTLNANTEKTITFLVEEVPGADNPDTSDNISIYIVVASIMLAILSLGTVLKRKY